MTRTNHLICNIEKEAAECAMSLQGSTIIIGFEDPKIVAGCVEKIHPEIKTIGTYCYIHYVTSLINLLLKK